MTIFSTHFIQHWLKPQNQLFLKKISLAYSKYLLPVHRAVLIKFITKPLIQHPASLSYQNQSKKTRLKSAAAYVIHKAFLTTSVPTTFTRFANFRMTNKEPFLSTLQTSQLKKAPKQSFKISLLVKTLAVASKCDRLRSSHISLTFKKNLRLQTDFSKRLNAFMFGAVSPINSTQRVKDLPLACRMLDLFFSVQFYRQRKFRQQTFIQRYTPNVKNQLKFKNQALTLSQRWHHRLDENSPVHIQHSILSYPITSADPIRRFKISKSTSRFIQVSLYTHPENVFRLLPNASLFTPKEQYMFPIKLVWPATLPSAITLSLHQTKIFHIKNNLPSTHNRFQIGFKIPLFLNLQNLSNSCSLLVDTQSTINRYLHLTSFVTTLITKRFLVLLTFQHKILSSRSNWASTENILARNSVLDTYSTRFSHVDKPNQNENNRLTSIRFKPGYARQWRNFRHEFIEFFSLKKRYQYRLTRYIAHLTISQRKNRILFNSLSVTKALVLSKLTTDLSTANTFIDTGLTFLNGAQVTNGSAQLLQNDLIQLTVFLKYYIVYKVQKNQLSRLRRTLGHLMWKFGKKRKNNHTHYPLWVKNFNTSFFDTPLTLEVDYFSSSCYILDSIHLTNFQHPYVLPLYNWKYIV